MFVDESGNPRAAGTAARDSGVYIQSGVIAHDDRVHAAGAAIERAKCEPFRGKDPAKVELHGYEMWRNWGRFASDPRIPDQGKKLEIFARTSQAIAESGSVLLNVIAWKNRISSGQRSLLGPPRRLLTERFDQYLATCGSGEAGSIVADASSRGAETKIGDVAQKACNGIGRCKSRPSLVLKDIRFVDSLSEPLVQAADTVAYIIHKHCRGDGLLGRWFNALAPCMWQHDGRIKGFGISYYPP